MKKYMGLLLCLSLFLTACGKDETTNSKSETVESTTSASTEAIEETTSIVTTEAETEAPTIEQISENNNEILQGVQWNDGIETVKSSMTEYICSFEESYAIDTGETKTCLGFMDVKLYGETLDVSFILTDGKLTEISYTYIQSTTKTKSLEDWSVMLADTYGEHSSVESAGFYSLYTWDSIMDDSAKLELSSFDGGVNINLYSIQENISNPVTDIEGNTFTDEKGRIFFNKTIDDFLAEFNELNSEFDCEKSGFVSFVPETTEFFDMYYIASYADEWSFMGDDHTIAIMICTNDEGYIFEVKIEIAGLYSSDYNISRSTVFAAMDAALNQGTTFEKAKDNYSIAYDKSGEMLLGNNGAVYWSTKIPYYNKAESPIFTEPENKHDYYSYAILAGKDVDNVESNNSDSSDNSGASIENNGNLNDTEIEQQLLSILNTTPLTDGYSTTIGMAMNAAFVDYDVTYKLATGFEHTYNVTFSGTYYPNPEVPQYTNTGSITYSVNLETGDCFAKSDFGGIEDVLLAYAVNYLS